MENFRKISGQAKTRELLNTFIEDDRLITTLLFLEKNFPKYKILLDEVIAEGSRVVIRGRTKGSPEGGDFQGPFEVPFVIGCRIERRKIADHWFMADNQAITEQFQKKKKF